MHSEAQVIAMLPLLPLQAWAAVALSYFAGLVRSEIRGLEWGDYDGGALRIERSRYGNDVGPTKTEAREAPVQVIEPLLLARIQTEIQGLRLESWCSSGARCP